MKKGLNEFLNILKPKELKELSQIPDLHLYFDKASNEESVKIPV